MLSTLLTDTILEFIIRIAHGNGVQPPRLPRALRGPGAAPLPPSVSTGHLPQRGRQGAGAQAGITKTKEETQWKR